MQASWSCSTLGGARPEQDDLSGKQPPKPDDQARMRFGFKPRRATQPQERGFDAAALPSPARSRCGVPHGTPPRQAPPLSARDGAACPAGVSSAAHFESVSLVEVLDAKFGDSQDVKELLNTKLVTDPRVFKERIAEVTDLNTKLKDALKRVCERRRDAREALAAAQADIDARFRAQVEEGHSQRSVADGLSQQLQRVGEELDRVSKANQTLETALKEHGRQERDLREEVRQHQKRLDAATSRAAEVEKQNEGLTGALEQSREEATAALAAADEKEKAAAEAVRELRAERGRFDAALEEQRAQAALSLSEAKAEAAKQLSESAWEWQRQGEEAEQQQKALREELRAEQAARVGELEASVRRLRAEAEAEASRSREALEQERSALQAQAREKEKAAAEELARVRAAAEDAGSERQRLADEERAALQEALREKERAAAEQLAQLQAAAEAAAEERHRAFEEERTALYERLRERDRAAEEQLAKLRSAADLESQERHVAAEGERAALQAQLREKDRASTEQRAAFQRELQAQDAAAAEERAALESKVLEGQRVAAEMRASFFDQIREKDETAARERAALQTCFQAQLQERDATLELATASFEAEREQLRASGANVQAALQASKDQASELQVRLAAEQEQVAVLAAAGVERQAQLDAARAQLEVLQKTRAELAAEREARASLSAEGALKQSMLEAARAQLEELQGARTALVAEQEARSKLQADLAVQASHLDVARAQLEEMQGTRSALVAEQEARAALAADGAVQQSQLQAARAQLEEAQRAKASLATASETLQSQLGLAQAELEEARRANGALSSSEAALRGQLGALRAELGEERSGASALSEQLRALRCELEEARRSGASLAAGEAALRAQLGGARAELDEERRAMQQVREQLGALQAQLSAAQAEVGEARSFAGTESDARASLADSVRELRARLGDALREAEVARAELSKERGDRRAETANLQRQVEKSSEEARVACQERRMLEVDFNSYKDHHGTSNLQQLEAISDLKITVEKLSQQYDQTQSDLAVQQSNMVAKQSLISDLERQVAEAEASRRELHNAMQELRGNIRVMCRVRPAAEGDQTAVQTQDVGRLSLQCGPEPYSFSFDKVFGAASRQEEIFEEVEGLVQSALDGYKVCLFAYGQTGSGKTFTMQGPPEPRLWGIIPRSLSKVFEASRRMGAQGWAWSLEASFLEVYNECLRDLLRDSADGQSTPLAVQHNDSWGTVVANASRVPVDSMDQIARLMARAAKQRAVGATDMNSESSRSHSIFALYLRGTNEKLGQQLHGALHLVDLAGSERLDKSGAEGDRLRETKNINRSLSCLADVFAAKAEGRSHVPFRNSKLTYLMEPCLSGQGKTLMLVNVGPEADNAHETLCSLRFAQRVSQCTTGGKPKRNAGALPAASGHEAGPAGPPQRAPLTARSQGASSTAAPRASQRSLASAR